MQLTSIFAQRDLKQKDLLKLSGFTLELGKIHKL